MRRRRFLQNLAAGTAGISYLPSALHNDAASLEESSNIAPLTEDSGSLADVDGHTLLCEFQFSGKNWKVYEDLRTRDGAIVFLSNQGTKRVLPKSAEAVFAETNPPYLGLSLDEIGLSGADLLADKLLQGEVDPDPAKVKAAAPPQGSNIKERDGGFRLPWNTFVGTRECFDTMPVFATGRTRTYHPEQYFSEITQELAPKRFEGLIGGWMPAVRKVLPLSDAAYLEIVVFGDVEAKDKFIVQTWHRTSRVENGKTTKVAYGYSYPAFPPRRKDPAPEAFYRALLIFAEYWQRQLHDASPVSFPDETYVNMSRHAIARELMVRPGGVYPKYGAVDRDYYGSEYDGFQDIFTSAVYTNLEWGRFTAAKQIIDNYFSDFVDEKGMINMRGPETAQFGMTLSLLARYYNYTRDAALLQRHRPKIEATAALLEELHEESLRLPKNDPGYGLIQGWSESDSCLSSKPMTWWLPYFANSAFASRGLKDLARVWPEVSAAKAAASEHLAKEWLSRSKTLEVAVVAAMRKDIRHDLTPPYIGPFPGTSMTFRDSLAKERPSPQQWPHRPYAELLQADILPADLANLVIDCMRAYGATTLGVVANVSRARPGSREILGFISYGYAQMLLRLDRVEEFLLFLYSHHYHDHTRGSWTAGEVSDINGGNALFCIPAQQTIPLLVRWMLVLEDSDEDLLYLAKGIPRSWVVSGKPIRIENAPTRWGRVSLELQAEPSGRGIAGKILLSAAGKPSQIHLKVRLPLQYALSRVTVNGHDVKVAGKRNDTVLISTGQQKQFDIRAQYDAS